MSFLAQYFDIIEGATECQVCCPFPHKTASGVAYFEQRPSASVNLSKGVFRCNACGESGSEQSMLMKLYGASYNDALAVTAVMDKAYTENNSIYAWDQLALNETTVTKLHSLGISDRVINELKIKSHPENDELMSFPVFFHELLLDIRTYNPGGKPKVTSQTGAVSGLVIPQHLYNPDGKGTVLICAGEKDMAMARTMGFDAYTVTGGENASLKTPGLFKDRRVVVCYDNDQAGQQGARRIATQLYRIAKSVRVCTSFHAICKEKGEDIYDFFIKYNQTKEDLIRFIKATKEFVPDPDDLAGEKIPSITIKEVNNPKYMNKVVKAKIKVVAANDKTYSVPSSIMITKKGHSSNKGDLNTMDEGETKEWNLTPYNCDKVLDLFDKVQNNEVLNDRMKAIAKVPIKEGRVKIDKTATTTVGSVLVADFVDVASDEAKAGESLAYVIGKKLEAGKAYDVTMKIATNQWDGQNIVLLITEATEAKDSVEEFVITEEAKANLSQIREIEGTTQQKVSTLVEKVKGILNFDGNGMLIAIMDLAYHTVLEFDFGRDKNVRGYLDTLIVGESRTGKSATAKALRETYGLGAVVSLAGGAATEAGLVGGSQVIQGGGHQTRAGVIPQNHKGLIVFEELAKCNSEITKKLTDIRSSNMVRITRVSGTTQIPAIVRMISLTNVKNSGGVKSIGSYPNGIEIIRELASTAEDIARYDVMLVMAEQTSDTYDPLWEPLEPFSKEVYRTRIKWVWSRKPNQIKIDRDVAMFIMATASDLNAQYETHIKIFGTEAWKKLTRLAIAIAGYTVSTDETYENIIVTEEHVTLATRILVGLYDNETFKLGTYVENERKYKVPSAESTLALTAIYGKSPALIKELEVHAEVSKSALSSVTGLANDDLNPIIQQLKEHYFVTAKGNDIIPTVKFRKSVGEINTKITIQKLGV